MPRPGVEVAWEVRTLATRSVEVILENQDASGAYVAAPGFPPYAYCWFRDGAFIAHALSGAGEIESAEAFFGWCARALEFRAGRVAKLVRRHRAGETIDPEDHLHCRLHLDGTEGDAGWALFQLDGYGAWLWALGVHAERHGRSVDQFEAGASVSVRYLAEFWSEPCFDWWEERLGCHTVTLAAIRAGLLAASGWELDGDLRAAAATTAAEIERAVRAEAVVGGRLGAGFGDVRLDASLLACGAPFGLVSPDDPLFARTVGALEDELAHRGVHRHAADSYYGGGEWILLAALLGLWHAAVGRTEDAWAQLDWIVTRASPQGDLPEQVSDRLLVPGAYDEWVARWGAPASPLLWSHAMFLTLAHELGAVGVTGD